MLHQALARSEHEQAAGVWLASEDEAASIATPLANIANRRAGAAAFDADTGDLIAAGVAAAGYVLRNATTAVRLRIAVRRAAKFGMTTDPEHDDTQENAA